MPLNPNDADSTTAPRRFECTDRDILLYALGVGAGRDDLAFTIGNSQGITQKLLPTYAVIACSAFGAAELIGTFDASMRWHGSQQIRLFSQLARAGSLDVSCEVADIQDKGPGKNAIVILKAAISRSMVPRVAARVHTSSTRRCPMFKISSGIPESGSTTSPSAT